MDRPSRQKMGKEILNLNYALDQGALTDIHRTFYQQQQNTHAFQAHTEHSLRVDYIIGNKS